MNRLLWGAAIGGALVYFFDRENGEVRRMRVSNWISQYVNADTMEQARQATQSTMEQARSLTGQVSEQVSQMRSGRRAATSATSDTAAANNATKAAASAQS